MVGQFLHQWFFAQDSPYAEATKQKCDVKKSAKPGAQKPKIGSARVLPDPFTGKTTAPPGTAVLQKFRRKRPWLGLSGDSELSLRANE